MCKVNSSLYYAQEKAAGRRREVAGEAHWIPNTDVYVADGNLVIKVELAGMRQEDLELTVDGHRLMISGHRPDGCRPAKCKFLVMEINYGSFECVIEVPRGYELSRAKASYQNGFLRVDVPQVVRSSPKNVLITLTEEK